MESTCRIEKADHLNIRKEAYNKNRSRYKHEILICAGTGCTSSRCQEVKKSLLESLELYGILGDVLITETGCRGACDLGPIMAVMPEGIFYTKLKAKDMPSLVETHFINGSIKLDRAFFDRKLLKRVPGLNEISFFNDQTKIALRNCGSIDYSSIDGYIAKDGYMALAKVLNSMSPVEVIDEVKASGLRGRGGGGFPTGVKWEAGYKACGSEKCIVCNADEGDPGAFMDRSIMEGDPHTVIEGMIIGGYAIGASKGYVYIRAEYPIALSRIETAVIDARESGLLGKNIFCSGFDFDIEIKVGAGAFVCGEETALIASIEGNRGEPRQKPPFPFQKGLFGEPTIINNVETFANIPPILLKGSKWFSKYGTEGSKGTKVFALAGDINNIGLVEVPMGITLREIIYGIGGGIPKKKEFKAAQIGGPSGGCISKEHLDTPVDYDSLKKLGVTMGSGGLIVMNEDTCMVDIAKFFMEFVQDESCGKCLPCRVGTKTMLDILNRITANEGQEGDIELLENLGTVIKETSLCGLGQTAPNPVLSTLKNFREEYEAHIKDKRCLAGGHKKC